MKPALPSPAPLPATEIQYLRGVGPARARLLANLGIRRVADLLRHYPRDYDDRTELLKIGSLRPELDATVRGRVASVVVTQTARRRVRVTAVVEDDTGSLVAEFWQQPYRAEQMAVGRDVLLSGRVAWDRGPKMTGPEVETHTDDDADL